MVRAMLVELDTVAMAELEHALARQVAPTAEPSLQGALGAAGNRSRGFVDRAPGSRVAYSRSEAIAAVRRCAEARGRRPTWTWTTYRAWAAVERRRRRQRDGPTALPRIPSWSVFARLWPRQNYTGALAAAAITDEEVRRWRRALLGVDADPFQGTPSPGELISALSDSVLIEGGLGPDAVRTIRSEGIDALVAPDAARVAAVAGGDISWAAGQAPLQAPERPLGLPTFDVGAMRVRRKRLGITDRQMRLTVGETTVRWNRILRGSEQPSLGLLKQIAGTLGVTVTELCSH